MDGIWTGTFWKRTIERAVKTLLQAYLASWGILEHNFDSIANIDSLKVAVAATVLSLITSLLSVLNGDEANPSAIE